MNKKYVMLILLAAVLFGCKTTGITPIPVVPIVSELSVELNLETVQKVLLWGESGTVKLQDIINKKRCAMSPKDVIVTDTKINLKEVKKVQKAGGKVALLVHPWYSPWNRGKTECLRIVEENAKYYDYIALDYEGPLANADFAKKLQGFGKTLIVTPMARGDAMEAYFEGLSALQNVVYCWWNYNSNLSDWNDFFTVYKFPDSNKHLVLLSVGKKYRKHVSDAEIKNIVENLKGIRAGTFSPKNDYAAFRTMSKSLEKGKLKIRL